MEYVPVRSENDFYINLLNSKDNIVLEPEYIKKVRNDKLTLNDVEFKFSADIWNFSSIKKKNQKSGTVYYFNKCKFSKTNIEFLTLLKFFILNQIEEYGPYSKSPQNHMREITRFLEFLESRNLHSILNMTVQDIKDFIWDLEDHSLSYSTLIQYKSALHKFLNFCSISYVNIYTKEMRIFLTARNIAQLNSERESNKLKLLPTSFIRGMKKVLNDRLSSKIDLKGNELSNKTLIIDALILIDIYSGLRPQELLLIPYNCISKDQIDDERIIYIFSYCQSKEIKNGYRHVSQVSFKEVSDAIDLVKKLTQSTRVADDWLIEDHEKIVYKNIINELQKLCIEYRQNLNNVNLTDKEHDKSFYQKVLVRKLNVVDMVSLPRLKQFRVYYSSDLRKQGVSSLTIAQFLGHTASQMIDYYGRDVNPIQENYDFSKEFMKNIIQEQDKLLGPRGKEYEDQIHDILSNIENGIKGKYIDDAVKEVLKQMPIRQKNGGVCIKPAIGRPCSFDSKTNDIYCAFGMCPNQIHVYYNLPYYYSVFKNLQLSYNHNLEKGFKNAAEKELNKIHYVILHYLDPEMKELRSKISLCKTSEIIHKHPDVRKFIEDMDTYVKEFESWREKKTM